MPVPSSASTSTPMSYDRFKPKFPLDPFAAVDQAYNAPPARLPWTLDADALPPPSVLQHERRVILIIGQPTGAALAPLFSSPHLVSSLLIIASHRPPPLPFDSHPAVHTLRLRTPLAVADAGATRLIDILEWALQVARLWRRTGGPKKQELMEEVSPGSESVRLGQSFGRLRYSVAPDSQQEQISASAFSPGASMTSLTPSTAKKSRRQSLFRRQSALPIEPDPTSSKPFDALLHFLPADAPDKARLKAAILVTTLTRPYLSTPPSRVPSTRFYPDSTTKLSGNSGKRWSFSRGASSLASLASSTTLNVPTHSMSTMDFSDVSESGRTSLSTLSLLRARRSRLVHLMPSAPTKPSFPSSAANSNYMQTQAHLIRSIEAFLLSFCFQMPLAIPSPVAGFVLSDSEGARARPYLVPATALAEVLHVESDQTKGGKDEGEAAEAREENKKGKDRWTLAELLLCGALESKAETARSARNSGLGEDVRRISNESEKGKQKQLENSNGEGNEKEWMAHRAWIAGIRDVVVGCGPSSKTEVKAHAIPARSSSQPQLPTQPQARSYSHLSHSPSQLQSYSQSQSRPQALTQTQSQPHPHPHLKPQPPPQSRSQSQLQVQAHAIRNLDLYTNSSSNSGVYMDTKREKEKEHQMSAYKALAIEKRLPTPPEDEDGEQGDDDDDDGETVYPTTPNTSGQPQPHYVEYGRTSRVSERERAEPRLPHSRSHPPAKRRSAPLERRSSESRRSPRLDQRRARESYTRSSRQQEMRSRSRMTVSTSPSTSPPISPVAASTSTYTPASTIVPTSASASGHHSGPHHYRPARSPPRMHDTTYEVDHAHEMKKQRNGNKNTSSLPTPPDSEEASLEGTSDPVVVPATSPSREHKHSLSAPRSGAVAVSPSREYGLARDERRHGLEHDRSRHADVDDSRIEDIMEREREREQRRRTHSHPSRPTSVPALAERTPPRRAKTKPKERSPKEIMPHENMLERRVVDESAKIRPDGERDPSSEERRAKRVPVPSMEDLLPPLPPPSPPPVRSQQSISQPPSETTSSHAHQTLKRHAKWKFWKAGSAVVNA